MNNELFQKLNELEVAKSRLEDEIDIQRELCKKEMQDNKETSIEFPFAVFSIYQKPSYTYSNALMEIEKDFKAKKKIEEINGTAEVKMIDVFKRVSAKSDK